MNKYELTKRAILEKDKKLMEQRNYHAGVLQEIDSEMTSNRYVLDLIEREIKNESDRNTIQAGNALQNKPMTTSTLTTDENRNLYGNRKENVQ